MKKSLNPELKKISQDRIINIIAEDFSGSQQDFADACGLGKSSVSQYVNRTNSPGNMTSAKIGKALGLNPLWVMGFDVPREIKNDADEFRKFAKEWNSAHQQSLKVTENEFDIIKKYRTLDEYGKKAVGAVLDVEHERCQNGDDEYEEYGLVARGNNQNKKLKKKVNEIIEKRRD